MDYDRDFDPEPIDDFPVAPAVRFENTNPYGSVPGLSDDELADPRELSRMAFVDDWEPILTLPDRYPRNDFHPALDEFGDVDGAFGSVDFDRLYGRDKSLDKARYKAEAMEEDLRGLQYRLDSALERVPDNAKYQVLAYLRRDIIQLDHIVGEDMQTVARLDARMREQREEIGSLRDYSCRRQHHHDE